MFTISGLGHETLARTQMIEHTLHLLFLVELNSQQRSDGFLLVHIVII